MLKFVLATLFLITQVFALKYDKKGSDKGVENEVHKVAEDSKKGENFAYVTLLKFPPELNKTKAEKAAAEPRALKEMGTMEVEMENGQALPTKGRVMEYGPERIFKMDEQLRKYGAKYPLVVLTDDPRLIKSDKLKDHPNLKILRIPEDIEAAETFYSPKVARLQARLRPTIQKLSFFNMTQYDKLVSFDLDVLIQDNLDHLFKEVDTEGGETVFGAFNSFKCGANPNRGNVKDEWNLYFQSSVMVLTPQKGIIEKIRKLTFVGRWGDQHLIQDFFRMQKKPAQLLPAGLISQPNCDDAKTAAIIHQR